MFNSSSAPGTGPPRQCPSLVTSDGCSWCQATKQQWSLILDCHLYLRTNWRVLCFYPPALPRCFAVGEEGGERCGSSAGQGGRGQAPSARTPRLRHRPVLSPLPGSCGRFPSPAPAATLARALVISPLDHGNTPPPAPSGTPCLRMVAPAWFQTPQLRERPYSLATSRSRACMGAWDIGEASRLGGDCGQPVSSRPAGRARLCCLLRYGGGLAGLSPLAMCERKT